MPIYTSSKVFKNLKDVKGVHPFGVEIFDNDDEHLCHLSWSHNRDSLPKGAFPLGGVDLYDVQKI